MNFKTMTDRVKWTLGAEENVYNDETALIKKWLNDGVVQILVRTRPFTRCINLSLTPNTAVYDMQNQILALVDVSLDDYGFLRRYSRQDIVDMQERGEPGFAYEEPLLWISPITTESGVLARAYGVFRPTPMSADNDDPAQPTWGGLAPEFHEAIVIYALWKLGEYVQHQGSGEGERWRIQYEGQDGTEGEIARIKRIHQKRVTPGAVSRRALTRNLGGLSRSGEYLGAT